MNVHSNLSSALKSQSHGGMKQTITFFPISYSPKKSKMINTDICKTT